MVPRENKTNAYAKFGGTNKEYYGIFRTGLFKPSGVNVLRVLCLHYNVAFTSKFLNQNVVIPKGFELDTT